MTGLAAYQRRDCGIASKALKCQNRVSVQRAKRVGRSLDLRRNFGSSSR